MTISMFIFPLLGGMLAGCAALLLLLGSGRIAGYSGIIANAISQAHLKTKGTQKQPTTWRWLFLIGTLCGGFLIHYFAHIPFESFPFSPVILLAGFLVGIGTRLGNGCTSGHGICGVGRLSPRSMVATAVFVICGIVIASCFY